MTPAIRDIRLPLESWRQMEGEAEVEGHGFVRRTREAWEAGVHRFEAPGEFLAGAFADGALVGIGGLSLDPYSDEPGLARLRHLFVRAEARRLGVGRMMVEHAMARAWAAGFRRLRLRTSNSDAARLYVAMGFRATGEPSATHTLELASLRD